MESMLTIVSKVLIMLVMILVGYFLTQKAVLTSRGASEITDILIKLVTPCVIVNSFIDSRGSLELSGILFAALIPIISMVINVVVSRLSFRKETEERKTVLQFSVLFGNVGFMGVPLVQGIVGESGVVYASFAIVVFNIFCWTYGYRLMNKDAKLSTKTVLLNPGVIGIVIGLPLYFMNFEIPNIIREPIAAFAGLNTPLAMMIIGSYVAKVDMRSFVSDISVYKMSALRLLICPAIFFAVLLLLRPEPELFLTGVIQAAMPVAANTVLFAVQYKKDSELASKAVAVSTVLSVLTIPLFTILAEAALRYL